MFNRESINMQIRNWNQVINFIKCCIEKKKYACEENLFSVSRNQGNLAPNYDTVLINVLSLTRTGCFHRVLKNSKTDKTTLKSEMICWHSKVYSAPHGCTSNLKLNVNFQRCGSLDHTAKFNLVKIYQTVQFLNNVRIQNIDPRILRLWFSEPIKQ